MLDIKKRIKEHLDYVLNEGYEVFGIYLQGSQNYMLETENSDIDTKCIVIPSLSDIVLNKEPISKTIVLENNEHIDVKDIRIMFDIFKKQNINFIEILFTEYKIINQKYKDLDDILTKNNEQIARMDINKAINCMIGMAQQKYVALKHPYPTIIDKIKKYGYDPKQLHHIVRMKMFIERYINGEPYSKCLIESEENRKFLIDIKNGNYSLEQAEQMAKTYNDSAYAIGKAGIKKENQTNQMAIKILQDIQVEAITRYLKGELLNG